MTECVACLILRGERNKINEVMVKIQEHGVKVVLAKFGPASDYFLVKRLRRDEWLNETAKV